MPNDTAMAGEWTADAAEAVAASQDLVLTSAHWRVISCWREVAARDGRIPGLDDLQSCCHITASEIRTLFPGATSAVLSRIAGLPD